MTIIELMRELSKFDQDCDVKINSVKDHIEYDFNVKQDLAYTVLLEIKYDV